jgi:hypothetical protein
MLGEEGLFLYLITLNDEHTHSVVLLCTKDRPVAATSTCTKQHLQEIDIHAPSGIRTRNTSKRTAAVPHFRRRGHRDRLRLFYYVIIHKDGVFVCESYS